jgi:hypothetical protein
MKVKVEVVRYRKRKPSSRQKKQDHDPVSPSDRPDPRKNRTHPTSGEPQRDAGDAARDELGVIYTDEDFADLYP